MSPSTPATSSGTAPSGAPAQSASSVSRSPLSGKLSALDEQQQPAPSSGGGPVSNKPAVLDDDPTLPTVQEAQQPVPPVPEGALEPSFSAPLAPTERAAAAAAETDDEAGVALRGTASGGPGDEAGQKLEPPGGDEEASGLMRVSAPLPDEENVSEKGYMGKRFIQAAEVRCKVENDILFFFVVDLCTIDRRLT